MIFLDFLDSSYSGYCQEIFIPNRPSGRTLPAKLEGEGKIGIEAADDLMGLRHNGISKQCWKPHSKRCLDTVIGHMALMHSFIDFAEENIGPPERNGEMEA